MGKRWGLPIFHGVVDGLEAGNKNYFKGMNGLPDQWVVMII
ncbi:hypothetical protein [Pelistega europaea]|nr:hypothetical protein [Pelistega europaea]